MQKEAETYKHFGAHQLVSGEKLPVEILTIEY